VTETLPDLEATPDGYPDGAYPLPRRMGQFSRLQMGGYRVVPEDQLVSRTYFGLPHTDTWFDALLTTASGDYYVISHDVWSEDGAMRPAGLLGALKATAEGLTPEPRYANWDGPITQSLTPDGQVRYDVASSHGSEQVTFDATSFAWRADTGDLVLRGSNSGGGTMWRHSWRRPDGETGEMFYNQQGYAVDGTLFGEAVTGHVVIETMWGNEHYMNTWFVQNRIGHWAFFAIDYDDGTSEFAQFLCGEYGARGAVVTDGNGVEVLNTANINAVELPDGGIRYEVGNNEEWEVSVEPSRALSFPRTRLGFGTARRIGDPRKVVRSTCSYLIADHIPADEPFN
jgi:hypothetical protein